jgi:hypothetical protein
MTIMVLSRVLELFPRAPLHNLSLQAASRHRPIAFDPEGSPLDPRSRCLTNSSYHSRLPDWQHAQSRNSFVSTPPLSSRLREMTKAVYSLTSRIGLGIGTPEW